MSSPASWIPFRWPDSWSDPALAAHLAGTPLNSVLAPSSLHLSGLNVLDPAHPDIASGKAGPALWTAAAPVLIVEESAWPGVRVAARKSEDLEAGPTGVPWLDSNAWTIAMARALAPSKKVWIAAPPPQDRILTPADYQLAIADAALRGGRWIVQLDDRLAKGIAAGNSAALASWTAIKSALNFREQHSYWSTFETDAPLGVVSDFTGDNEFLAGEILNLASRRSLLYRVIPRATLSAGDLHGLEAVLYVDPQPPSSSVLRDFATRGGLVVAPAAAVPKGDSKLPSPVPGYTLEACGNGRVAHPETPWEDPYLIAAAVHNLASRRIDPLRIFNTGTALWNLGRSDRKSVAQIVNYTGRPASNPVTISVQRQPASAKLYTLEKPGGAAIPVVRRKYSVEFPLPDFSVWAAVEMEA